MICIDFKVESRYRVDRERIKQVVIKTLAEHGVNSDAEVSIVVCGERKIRELHKKYMTGDDELHDVLSFPLDGERTPDGIMMLGDIVVCYPVAVSEAAIKNMLVDDEIDFLVQHSCLHLLGIHHE